MKRYYFYSLLILLVTNGCKNQNNTDQSVNNEQFGILIGTVLDAQNNPLTVRVRATDANDSVYMARNCIPYSRSWFAPGHGTDHFTTIGSKFSIVLPAGKSIIQIERGKEYVPVEKEIEILPGNTIEETLRGCIKSYCAFTYF